MKYLENPRVTFQEVPDETSLIFEITNCPFKCDGCHSPWMRDNIGTELTPEIFEKEISKYTTLVTCVCFMGGDQHKDELKNLLQIANNYGFKTALYTGATKISNKLSTHLTYLKVGQYNSNLGGLNSLDTNQKFTNIISGEDLTYRFHK